MVFSSMLFVFLFLTANLLTQLLLQDAKTKNICMLAFSLVFYSWAGVRYLPLLLGMALVCWAGALLVDGCASAAGKRCWMAVAVTVCLIILGIFKYTGFLVGTVRGLFNVPGFIPNIVLPIGISFYTFQLISYVVDVYRGEVAAQKKYWVLLLYASLFHQCIAGPIVRYRDVEQDIIRRRTTLREGSAGVTRFAVGLAKKAVLANGCAVVADQLLVGNAQALAAVPAMGILLGVFAYSLQIYLDFSAYSDMAIGMGLMCGFHYKENFNYPYMSGSISEFWRRWHISLGSFFRDYVYIPLGGNRCGRPRQLFNLGVVWFLTGMWHGASWNFILWGLFFGVLIALERFVLADRLQTVPAAVRHGGVLLLVMFSWMIFKFTDMALLGTAIKGLFGLNHNGFTSASVGLLFKNNVFFLIFASIATTPLGRNLRQGLDKLGRTNGAAYALSSVWEILCPVGLLVLSAMALVGDSYNPFLYFQF